MLKTLVRLLVTIATSAGLHAATITHWNFNSNPPDTSTSTGILTPATGDGTAARVGGPAESYATGSPNDPAATDNTGANTQGYPAQGTGNKTSGLQFNVSTRGYSNIVVGFEQRITGTGSRYFRFQYSIDGSNFIDHSVIDLSAINTFFPQTISLGNIPGASDNPTFAFRSVAEFENTATLSGSNGYVTVTVTGYTPNGASRFDLVTVSGDSLTPGNTPPSITDIPDQIIPENTASDEVLFFIGDSETPPEMLVMTRASSNTNLIPVDNIVIVGTLENRTVVVTPAANQFGSAIITITVTDEGSLSASDSFVVTVFPLNAPPTISAVPHQHTLVGTPTSVPVTVGDVETAAGGLSVTVGSSNPSLIPAANITTGGTDAERTVTLTPVAGQAGTAVITLTVTDGGQRSVSTSFVLMVIPTATTLLYETFNYPSGSLVTNSASFWSAHDGIVGQTRVDSERIALQYFQNEDLHAPLLNGPYGAGSGVTLYASFQVAFTDVPLAGGQYFAHFGSGVFRARIFATTENAALGALRLGIANGAGTQSAQFPLDLILGATNRVVVRYRVDPPESTLWVNPNAETDPGTNATDTASTQPIGAFSLRQAAGIGQSLVDSVFVGTTFADVVDARPRLQIALVGADVHVSWPASYSGYILQFKTDLAAPSWTDYPGALDEQGGNFVARLLGVTDSRFFQLVK